MNLLTSSSVITGLWQIADMERDGRKTDPALLASEMKKYIDAGLSMFDMADHYGSSELITGNLLKNYPDIKGIFLTKWVPDPANISKEETRKAVIRALERMKLDQLPLLQFHAWQYANPNWLDCLWWLEELRSEGLIANIGVTNFDTAHLNMALQTGINISSNQICFSLLDRRAQNGMLDLCMNHNISVYAFGTVAGGFFSERWLNKPEPAQNELQNWSLMKYKRFIDVIGGWEIFQRLLRSLHDVATRHQVSIANIASRYILDTPGITAVIIGARLGERSHLESNLKLQSLKLSVEDRKLMKSLLNEFQPVPGDCGDEYRKPPFLTASGDLSHHLGGLPNPFRSNQNKAGHLNVFSGTIWEPMAGFSRAVRLGNKVYVSGTTATHGSRVIGGQDPGAQTHFILDKIEGALISAGSSMDDIVRTRVYIKNTDIWEPVARAHGQRLGHIMPANTMVAANIIGDEYLVEIEAEAVVRS